MRSKREQKPLNSSRLLATGFAAMILLGACVLALPAASSSDRGIGFMNALFTATSSVCVTGLSVIDVSRALSRFGQTVQLLLIQMGGLGFMVFGTFLFAVIGRRITLRGQLLLSESMNAPNLSGLMRLIYWVLGLTLGIELAGAALLCCACLVGILEITPLRAFSRRKTATNFFFFGAPSSPVADFGEGCFLSSFRAA